MLSNHYEACCKSNCEQWAAKCYKKCLLLVLAISNTWYCVVGNFREGFIFAFFASQEPFAKIKTAKFLCPHAKWTNCVSIPAYLYSRQQKRVSECAFDGYRWSYPENRNASYVSTGTWTRQRRKSESGSNRYYERPRYEATFLASLEQRAEIAIKVFVNDSRHLLSV